MTKSLYKKTKQVLGEIDPDSPYKPKLGDNRIKRGSGKRSYTPRGWPLTKRGMEKLKNLIKKVPRYGDLKVEDLSLSIRTAFHKKPKSFKVEHVKGTDRIVYKHKNPNGKEGGIVEITCHLHPEHGLIFIDKGCYVLLGSVLQGPCFIKRKKRESVIIASKVLGGSYVEDSQVLLLSMLKGTRIYNSKIDGCDLKLCNVLDSIVYRTNFTGEIIYWEQILPERRSIREERQPEHYPNEWKYMAQYFPENVFFRKFLKK